jgi:hypothetical protein
MILYRVYFYIYRPAQSVQGQNFGAGKKKNRRWICGRKKKRRDFSVLCTNYMGSGAHAASYKTNIRDFVDGKSGWE